MDKILPIGAIVLLKDAKDYLMIVGYLPKGIDEKERDYMGVVYPTGYTSLESVYTFNHVNIEKVIFNGNENNIIFAKLREKINKNKEKSVKSE